MAIKEEFEIRISPDGEMKIVAKGFSGKECEIPLEKIQQALKAEGQRIEHTDEYFKDSSTVDAKIREQ